MKGWKKEQIQEQTKVLLEKVGLSFEDYANRYPKELSGGEQQRVGIVRAIIATPKILLMDEPFSALDAISRKQLQDLTKQLHQEFKMTTLFVTHDTDEAVKLGKKIAGNITGKFVNGILRNIERNASNLDLKYKNATEKFCIENSCPSELYNILKEQYGVEKAQKIVVSFNEKSKNSIRYNPLKITKKELIEKLGDAVSESEICEDSLVLNKLNLDSSLFTKGYYIVQDEASALVASSIGLPLDKEYKILDTCAAPGGKSLHIASKYFNSSLISCDKYIHKLKLIEDNKEKLGITNIDVKEQDATLNNTSFNNKFDIVICDVPCSGIGVIKNKPEIKYKITDAYVKDIAKLQYDILDNSKHYVKQEGILMYSTCTIDKRENIKNIEKFLKENKDFSLESISLNNSIVKTRENGVLEILPDEYSCDGFFIAKLKKMEAKC